MVCLVVCDQGVLLGPVWQKWGNWLGSGALFAVLLAMGSSPYMGGGVVPWLIIYGPLLLFLYWLLRRFVQIRPGVFTLSLALLLAVRLALNGISYEVACQLDQPVLLNRLDKPASFRHVYFYDGAPEIGKVASVCDGICLTLLTMRDVAFVEISPDAPDMVANKNKQRVRYNWQNPACVAWVRDHPKLSDRVEPLHRGSMIREFVYNSPSGDRAIRQSQWDEVKSCFIYDDVEKFEAAYSYTATPNVEINYSREVSNRVIDFKQGVSLLLFNYFDRSAWVLFDSRQHLHDGLLGAVGTSIMYSYRAFAIPAIDPVVGLSHQALIGEPTSEACGSHGTHEMNTILIRMIEKLLIEDAQNDRRK
jgi:hypothetical protein